MKTVNFLFLVILCLLQSVSLKSQTNLVVNGDFEEIGSDGKPSGWIYSSGDVYEVSDVVPSENGGTKSLNVNMQTGSKSIAQDIAIEAGKTYKFHFQYNVHQQPTSNGIRLVISWRKTAGGAAVGSNINSEYLTCANFWLPYDDEKEAPEEATSVRMMINVSNGIGVYLDDVSVTEVGSTTGISSATKTPSLPVRSGNGNLVVSGAPSGSRIDVYSVVGSCLQSAVAAQGETVIPNLPKGQMLIVRSGNEAAKVAL